MIDLVWCIGIYSMLDGYKCVLGENFRLNSIWAGVRNPILGGSIYTSDVTPIPSGYIK